MSYHSSNHGFYAGNINYEGRLCDVCGDGRPGIFIYRCADCRDYDECSGCHGYLTTGPPPRNQMEVSSQGYGRHCHEQWHTFTRKDFYSREFGCDGCGVIISQNVYNCDQCPLPNGYDLCVSCFQQSGHTTSRSNSYASNYAPSPAPSYAPSYASSSSSSSRMTDQELQKSYIKAVDKKWQAGALVGTSWIGLMASAIIDAIQAHAFLPSFGQATFHVAKWAYGAKKAASTVFKQASELKAELRRRGASIPKLSFLGKAKSVLKGATNWSVAGLVGRGVNDYMGDDYIVFQ